MPDITVQELKIRLDQGENVHLLDVRETWEFDEYNINGKLIPLGDLPARISEIENWKQEEIIVHCRSGARSATAKAFLEQSGFANVRNLLGGAMEYEATFG